MDVQTTFVQLSPIFQTELLICILPAIDAPQVLCVPAFLYVLLHSSSNVCPAGPFLDAELSLSKLQSNDSNE